MLQTAFEHDLVCSSAQASSDFSEEREQARAVVRLGQPVARVCRLPNGSHEPGERRLNILLRLC